MTDQILKGLTLIANQAVKGSEYAADEHVAMHAIEEIKSLRRINTRLISDMTNINELLGGDGTEHTPTLLSNRIGNGSLVCKICDTKHKEKLLETYKAGFIEACKWPHPVTQDADSPAIEKSFEEYLENMKLELT